MSQLNFDASTVAPSEAYEVLPAGWYNAMIDQSDLKPTKGNDGAYLELRFTVLDGQHANRKVFARLNIRNANAQAQEIAYKNLSSICHAVGVMQVQDSQQLHGRPLKIKVKVRKDTTGQYEDSNDITSYKNINEAVGPVGGPAAASPWATQQPAQQAAMPPAGAPFAVQPQQPQQPQQPVQVAAPAAAAPQQAWAAPQAQQPWAAQPQAQAPQAVLQQFAQQPVVQQQQQQPAQGQPAWAAVPQMDPNAVQQAQAPVQQAPVQAAQPPHPAQSAMPAWMPQGGPQGGAPAWATTGAPQ